MTGPALEEATAMPSAEDHRSATLKEALNLPAGARHYRAFVGNPDAYDAAGAMQFTLMAALGLREWHTLLDIGCGSLSGGRLFIPYLLPGCYYGIEPEAWLVEDAVRFEIGAELLHLKRPTFRYADDFSLTAFDALFDFMLAQSVLTHASQAQLGRCLEQAKLALKPAGLFAASFYSKGQEVHEGDSWKYPGFASYPVKFVIERALQHGLVAYPLIWGNPYGHYWMIFAHDAQAERVAWLGDLTGEQRLLRILELTKQVYDLACKYVEAQTELKAARLELAQLRGNPAE